MSIGVRQINTIIKRTAEMKKSITITAAAVVTILVLLLTAGCAGARFDFAYPSEEVRKVVVPYIPEYPETNFAVINDLHIYDRSLGTSGEAFRKYLDEDRKMLVDSEEILLQAIEKIIKQKPQFTIVPGDLTKDGALICHQLAAGHLTALEANDISVFVVPGNHDILNPHAHRFTKEGHEKVEHVTPKDFADIYSEFGYGEALLRDPTSLSYVAEPVDGLWLLALDSAVYENNQEADKPVTEGAFTREQINWIEGVLLDAARKGKAVIAFMHHGVLEHFDSQEKYFGQYVIEDYGPISRMLAAYKVRLVFTGHYHAQDITMAEWKDDTFIYDIETGSLVTYPCPIRFVSVDSSRNAGIDSEFITSLPSYQKKGKDFASFAAEYVHEGIKKIAVQTMTDFNMKEEEAIQLSGQIADAFVAHYKGDEQFEGKEMITTKGLSVRGKLVVGSRKQLVYDLWTDKPPADNGIIINLTNGSWKEQ